MDSVTRSMNKRRQNYWFLTRKAVDALYVTDRQHASTREGARAASLAQCLPQGELPAEFTERFALDYDHSVFQKGPDNSPFASAEPVESESDGNIPNHEHPPWTATSRGLDPPCTDWPRWSQFTPWPRTCCAPGGW